MNTGWHPGPYSMLALIGLVLGLGIAAGARVLVSDVPAGVSLKLQENSTASCGW